MGDVIPVTEQLVDLTLNLGTCTDMKIIGEDVSRHGAQALCETPNMDIMYAQHTVHLRDIFYH